MAIERDLDELKSLALERGAMSAEAIPAHEVVFDERTINKCQFGCPSYGRFLTCPPYTPPPTEFEKALRKYKWAVLLECEIADLNRLVVEVEKAAMRLGYYMALGLKGQRCFLCEECVPPGEQCRDPLNARPSMSGLGINVFTTLSNAGIQCKLAMEGEEYTSWGMVLVD